MVQVAVVRGDITVQDVDAVVNAANNRMRGGGGVDGAIHTVGPNHAAGQTDRGLLVSCYRRCLEVADELGARTVAFPLVSAGVYGWPKPDAVDAAVSTLRDTESRVEEARLVVLDEATFDLVAERLRR